MKIGLFFGSFNPIHVGHLILAQAICENANLDRVWFVVSPQNPFKKSNSLLHEFDRLDMVQAAIKDDERFFASDIEFAMPKPSYTIDTLVYLQEKYPSYNFKLIMGEDNLRTFHKWKNFDNIIQDFEVLVYPRRGDLLAEKNFSYKNVSLIKAPVVEISSTIIRENISKGKSVKYLLPEAVQQIIASRKLYQ